MTISFPRDLPDPPHIRMCEFEVQYQQTSAPTRGGLVQVVNVGMDLWRARYETHPLLEADAEAYAAWAHSLRGGAKFFKMWHPLRRYALNYPGGYGALTRSGGGSFSAGTVTLTAIATLRDTLTVSTLPASFVFKPGDLVSVPYGTGGRTLHRVMEAVTANGSGVAVLPVEPTVPLAVTTSATCDLVKPWCKGVIDAKSIKTKWQMGRLASVSFDAMQVF